MTRRPQHSPTTDPSEGTTVVDDAQQAAHILEVLGNSNCRQILRATDSEALSAEELAERCDIALSTIYRKVDQLVDTGLLEERVRLSAHPQLTREYRLAVTSVDVTLADESGHSLEFSRRADATGRSGASDQGVTGD